MGPGGPYGPGGRGQTPDALPSHPPPVRPGLMQAAVTNPLPRAVPVRQYDNSAPPVPTNNQPAPTPAVGPADQKPPPVTRQEIEMLRQKVQNAPMNLDAQFDLAQKLVEGASTLADDGGRADQKMKNKNKEKFIIEAHKMLKKLVPAGNVSAMFFLADNQSKLGLANDPKEAFKLYQSAAKLNHAEAAYRVAVCCEMGEDEGGGTRRDPLKAIQWYKRAATLGDTPAMYKMGMIQLKGLLGQPKNPREAIVWLKRAAERADAENPHALHELVRNPPFTITEGAVSPRC